MNVITPFDNENYCDYIIRLKIERPLGINNKPKNFYTEGHHILPKCLNGNDDSTNIIIILSCQKHIIIVINYWLWKILK